MSRRPVVPVAALAWSSLVIVVTLRSPLLTSGSRTEAAAADTLDEAQVYAVAIDYVLAGLHSRTGVVRTQTDVSDVGTLTPIDLPDPSFSAAATTFRAKNATVGSIDASAIPSLHELRKATASGVSHAAPELPYITLSRVGMDVGTGRAVVYVGMGCGALCGQGQQIWLERVPHAGWRVLRADVVWVS